MKKRKTNGLAREVLKSGRVVDYKELRKIAVKEGYELRLSREGYKVLNHEGIAITLIPHRASKYVSRGILEALSSGEPSFRNRTNYSA